MDPVALGVLTSAVTTFATKLVEGAGGEAGKTIWGQISGWLGLTSDPKEEDLKSIPAQTAQALAANPALGEQVAKALESQPGPAGNMIVNAKNVGAVNNFGIQINTFH
jgi:hypothetical protein